ncbi:MAG TPA: ComF family protein [Pyrinomonadaceae bacterium]|nr:ComF family protein [Pyrinomonadaceae bacterium]
MIQIFLDSLLSLAFPQSCHICIESVENYADGVVCRKCWKNSRIFSGNEILCGKCGAYLRNGKPIETFCHRCGEHFYDQAKAVGIYEKALAASVLSLKQTPFLSKTLRENLFKAFENADFPHIEVLIPVPLSKKRRIERGFNQAEILGKYLAEKTKIKFDDKTLVRSVHTPIHRAGMDRKARENTVKKAFEVTRPKLIEGKNVLLIDDVFTSGATVSACAEILKKNGAGKVFVLTIARAV